VGHGLEADFNRKGLSAFSGRIGQRVASELCTVVDDGTIPGRRGSLNVDDEGHLTGRTVLIENGILRGYMQDALSARLTRSAATGNGRRESYTAIPMPRMTNTFMLPKGATLIGNGPDILTRVSMVGNDLSLDQGIGTCMKDGQSVPVGVGLPTIKVDEMTVGGTRSIGSR
jgi:TldD protein